ncbi:hypothetical protein [Paratractidigestivibacter sp.]|uniref:hypothetical protein n=1 Tax=Paratractidigestivibacter sp. TaxID=2847316 RepID=UPI002AC92352|nr:hypothetical protein [Paratractidigestivibacter sp.]
MATATTKPTTTKKKRKKKATPLNGFFHYAEQGGTFGGEICAGIGMAVLAVCGMFMNMQLVATLSVSNYAESTMAQIATNGEVYAMTWLASMIAAVIGTLIMGLVARRPFVQVSSLALSCVLVSTVSLNSGLTYYNMLAICFVANVVYLLVCAVPQARRTVFGALPAPVRAALPAAAGLLLAWIAAQLTGLFSVTSNLMPNYGTASVMGTGYVALSGMTDISDFSYITDIYHPQMLISAIAVVLTFAVFLYGRGRKGGYGKALAIGTVFFLVASVLACGVNWKNFNFALSFLWGRLWMAGSEDAMQAHLSAAIANLGIGKVFTQGFDFSGFTGNGGNLAVLFGSSLLSYVFMFAADAESTVAACDAALPVRATAEGEAAPEPKDNGLVFIANGAANVVAAVLGASPVAVGKESVAGARDRARSGLAAVVAAAVFAVSAVVWVVPTLCATITSYTISFNMYGHYGYCMQLLAQTSFSVADAVMVIVGLGMAVRAVTIDVRDTTQVAPFAATVAATVLTTNLAVGVAAGAVAHVLVNLAAPRRKKGQPKSSLIERVGGVDKLVLAAVSVVLLVLVAW